MTMLHNCNRDTPRQHPWIAEMHDMPCGYLGKDKDDRCRGCHRSALKHSKSYEFEITDDIIQVQRSWSKRWNGVRKRD